MRKIVFFDSLLKSFIGEYTFEYEQFEEETCHTETPQALS